MERRSHPEQVEVARDEHEEIEKLRDQRDACILSVCLVSASTAIQHTFCAFIGVNGPDEDTFGCGMGHVAQNMKDVHDGRLMLRTAMLLSTSEIIMNS